MRLRLGAGCIPVQPLHQIAREERARRKAEEIAAASAARYPGDVFNPQTQTEVTWSEDQIRAAENSRLGG